MNMSVVFFHTCAFTAIVAIASMVATLSTFSGHGDLGFFTIAPWAELAVIEVRG
jgi:hypothetical protein